MTLKRASLSHLMAFIAILAVGLATMRVATVGLTRLVIYSALLGLLVATVAAILHPRRGRGTLLGSVVFGWGYAVILMPIPQFNSGRSPSIERDDLTDEWRIDGLTAELACFLHPQIPRPTDPDPQGTIRPDPATGLYTKLAGGIVGPATSEEVRSVVIYNAMQKKHSEQVGAAIRAQLIALTIQGLAFALSGAVVGRLLSGDPLAVSGPPIREPESREGS